MSLSNKGRGAFRPTLLSVAIAATASVSLPVLAADDEAASAALEEVTVTGFRKSVMDSISTKRDAKAVVEAISAEDIGKLPDSSIAEAISRLPGLTSQRLDGRSSRVSIRGFGENESATTFNGREQVSIGDNRGVEFDLYPSEIMSGVTVYKTPQASLEAEGIAGVIDMQTVKPLERGERVIQVNTQYEMTSFDKLNPDGEDQGHRATISYIDQFADDKIGVAFAYNTMSSPNQEERWNTWGYPEFTYEGQNYSILGGAKPFVRSSVLDRDSAMLVVEAKPNEKLHTTFDALYVDFSDEKILRGIEIPFAWGQGSISQDSAVVDPATGFITSATTEGQRVVVRNDLETRAAELKSFGFNTKYDFSDSLQLEFDASHSAVKRDIWSFESYSGTGRGDSEGEADNLGYVFDGSNTGAKFSHELDYSDWNLIQMGGPLSWGASAALNGKYGLEEGDQYYNSAQDGFLNAPEIDDELTSLKLAATQMVEVGIVNEISYGVSYRDREKRKKSKGYYMTLDIFDPETGGMLVVPEQYRLGTASLDFIGMGDMIAYDAEAMLKDGYYNLTDEALTGIQHLTKSWFVNESVTAAFAQADFETEVAGLQLTGNAGLRYVYTDQQSEGFAGQVVDGLVVAEPTDISHDYSNFLPSLNLALAIDDQQTVRFGAAKTISRARLDEMNASVEMTLNPTPDENGNFWKISGGNPLLEPKEAVGLDLSYENYFSDEGYFSVAVFWKDLDSWHFDGSYEVDLTGVADPATGTIPETSTATGTGKVNGGGGTLQGYEVSVALPFNLFSESLDGFGLLASHTGVSSDVEDINGNEYDLPGLSKRIETFTFYYENHGFQARTSMRRRSDFKGEVYGIGFDSQQVDVLGETIWDAQIGYDFSEAGISGLEGLSVFLQGQNLTDEPFTTLSGDNDLQVRDYQSYGKTYLLGFSYKL
ncbi:TonB-dependent receptor [Microbulbifer rhizosphaerae]|uniref:Iron complex outermembrane receptor protein n=1 Tax=Microbulbifer rhizosphaerae TaxID=1562603 RepID=A0A7W4ZBM8_9GAMM|nr:TonB-dependent receptor [Microbulbifer rhizosphaerae]MBB3062470.1 iron complex outermembrane receptor protein [Microbulbifer rhizosphaerae]